MIVIILPSFEENQRRVTRIITVRFVVDTSCSADDVHTNRFGISTIVPVGSKQITNEVEHGTRRLMSFKHCVVIIMFFFTNVCGVRCKPVKNPENRLKPIL